MGWRLSRLRTSARPVLRATAVAAVLLLLFLLAPLLLRPSWIEYVDDAGIVLGYLVSGFAAAVAILSIPLLRELAHWLRTRDGRSFPGIGDDAFAMRGQIEGIVIPVSRYEQPAWILRHLEPEVVAFLYTSWSRDQALRLAEEFGTRAVFSPSREEIERTEMMLDRPHDPVAAKKLVERFLRRFREQGIPRERTFVDTTGGTAPMSIGAFLAAEETGASSIYVLGTAAKESGGDAIFIVEPEASSHGEPIYLSDRSRSEG